MKTPNAILIFIILALLLAACSRPTTDIIPTATLDLALVSTIAAGTLQAIPTQTQAPAEPLPTATVTTIALTVTVTPTITVTPTYVAPMLQFDGNTNCRKGPGAEYGVVTVVLSGQKAEPIGVSEAGNYWLIKNPNKGENCWVASDFARPFGSVAALPTVTAPPTPTPIPPNPPVWSAYNYNCEYASGGSNLTMNLAWTDRANNEDGYTIYRDGQVVVNLAPDSSSYVDVTFVASGQTVTYKVEVFNKAGRASSSTISASCQ